MEKLVELIKQYKEILGAIVAIMAGAFFVTDYFATKVELSVLQCQMQNTIAQTDSQMKIDQLSRRIISLETERSSQTPSAEKKTELDLEIKKLNAELSDEYGRKKAATNSLAPGACEKTVKGK